MCHGAQGCARWVYGRCVELGCVVGCMRCFTVRTVHASCIMKASHSRQSQLAGRADPRSEVATCCLYLCACLPPLSTCERVCLYCHHTGKEGKQMGVPMDPPAFVSAVQGLLGQVQDSLLGAATAFRDENIVDVTSYDELKAAVAEGE